MNYSGLVVVSILCTVVSCCGMDKEDNKVEYESLATIEHSGSSPYPPGPPIVAGWGRKWNEGHDPTVAARIARYKGKWCEEQLQQIVVSLQNIINKKLTPLKDLSQEQVPIDDTFECILTELKHQQKCIDECIQQIEGVDFGRIVSVDESSGVSCKRFWHIICWCRRR